MQSRKSKIIISCKHSFKTLGIGVAVLIASLNSHAAVTLENQYKVTDDALYFDGRKVGSGQGNRTGNAYDFKFGPRISAHGDAIKKHEDFVFTTWYRGGKYDRHVMLSRYNIKTGVLKTIEFPHTHTGFRGNWWIGESHNTIAVGISPLDGTIHMLYDMHFYHNTGRFKNDYFRYSYSRKNAATVPDKDFNLSLFVEEKPGDYTHVSLNGKPNPARYGGLTYPQFFLNENGDLLMHMRRGGNNNGAYVFSRYDARTSTWDRLTQFNHISAQRKGNSFNWGPYGGMKYINGKLRAGFQKRSGNNNDKFQYQNGIFYGYSDDPTGKSQWKNHNGQGFNIPFANPDIMKIFEPGNLVQAKGKDQVHIVGGFDFTVTGRGDVHFVSRVEDRTNKVARNAHTYKPAGNSSFITTTNISHTGKLYTYGNDVYIIGLKDGRPNILKTLGGTNNFETVYETKRGQKFSHGVPYIHEGKVYYYLQAEGTGSARPAYVQVIDLGVGEVNPNARGPEGYNFAAREGTTVNVRGTMNIAYGAQGSFHYHYNQTEDLQCSDAIFGDPKPGVAKNCYVQAVNGLSSSSSPSQSPSASQSSGSTLSSISNPSPRSNPSSRSSSSSGGSASQCNGRVRITRGEKIEIDLRTANCVIFADNLSGRTLQVWDSDTRACDFRGTVAARGGSGRLNISNDYVSSSIFAGRTLMFSSRNRCNHVTLRYF